MPSLANRLYLTIIYDVVRRIHFEIGSYKEGANHFHHNSDDS